MGKKLPSSEDTRASSLCLPERGQRWLVPPHNPTPTYHSISITKTLLTLHTPKQNGEVVPDLLLTENRVSAARMPQPRRGLLLPRSLCPPWGRTSPCLRV